MGCFLNTDLVIQNTSNTQNYNRYSYCLNNPLKYTDPSGYTQAQMWTSEMTESMSAALGAWATALGYSVSNGIGSSSGDGFVGSSSSTPRLDKAVPESDRQYEARVNAMALDVVGSLLNNQEGGYWSRSTGLVYFDSNIFKIIYSGTNRNHYQTLRGIQFKDGSDVYFGDEPASQGSDWFKIANDYSGIICTLISMGTETTNTFVRNQFKSATSWTGWTNLRNSQQAWRTAYVLGKTGAMTMKFVSTTGGVLGGLSAAYSTIKVINQYNSGGLTNVNGWDAADAFFGGAGTASAIMLYLGTTNPIGWATLGTVAAGYGLYRAGQVIYENY